MLRFVTTNAGKVSEAEDYLSSVVPVEQFSYDYEEIQSDSLGEIASYGVSEAFDASDGDRGVFVEDSGLFIESLGGFPGPYSSYVYATLGIDRVWSLTSTEANQDAVFRSVIAYTDGDGVETFEGTVQGQIVEPRGEGGFGYDPIFEYHDQTFAEMTTEAKNAVSHRGRALALFASWLAGESAEQKGVR